MITSLRRERSLAGRRSDGRAFLGFSRILTWAVAYSMQLHRTGSLARKVMCVCHILGFYVPSFIARASSESSLRVPRSC
ncbi:hypothetical protein CY34DRAFT_802537 [Suillus luteus UH-Slu-Lm8-n1]|uniref:Uncharacterized protein n=1 Tax=Suillus luteus UH-Slu-Lm8-n1 TaxID=930992 RepID=A0A0D0BEK7_9AGAM|nr:hypothetical protein CY34DRAFT_802537 [Suillus luteus UH-Slu-Lm8-n1]